MNYLIEIPNRNNGIYMIFNILEKKVYVGLAENMLSRTDDHFRAICRNSVRDDNKNLIGEKNKNFIHFAIYQDDKTVDDEVLRNIESLYIVIMRDCFGFGLYNDDKRNIKLEEITLENIEDEKEKRSKALNAKFKKYTSIELDEIKDTVKEELNYKWEIIKETFLKNNTEEKRRFSLTKESEDVTYAENDNEDYKNVLLELTKFIISKESLKIAGIDWDEKSVIDEYEDLNLDKIAIISNFGSHNCGTPYEILKKVDIDINNEKVKRFFWAMKNVNEEDFYKQVSGMEHVYVLLKTTASDNSGGKNVAKELDRIIDENQIINRDYESKELNKPDLMHSYKDKDGKWKSLPAKHTYVTIPVWTIDKDGNVKMGSKDEGAGIKAVAFIIKKVFICKESFDFKKVIKSIGLQLGQNGTNIIKNGIPKEKFIENTKERDYVECLIAELEDPYVVEISNTPNLSLYLKGVFNEEDIPRILFNVTKTGKNGIVLSACAFIKDKVYVLEDRKTCLGDLIATGKDDTNSDIKDQIENAENKKEGTYKLYFETKDSKRYEVICNTIAGEEDIKIRLSCEKQFTPNAMPHDLYKYYCFENEDDKSIWAFRYKKEERKKDRPPFVFDDESEFS